MAFIGGTGDLADADSVSELSVADRALAAVVARRVALARNGFPVPLVESERRAAAVPAGAAQMLRPRPDASLWTRGRSGKTH